MYNCDDCQAQADLLYSTLLASIDRNAPLEQLKLKNNDRPWVTVAFKNCIKLRDNAFRSGDADAYKCLRNKVNRLRKSLQKRYCNERVQQLKQHNPSRWWKEIKLLCGLRQRSCVTFENICYEGTDVEASNCLMLLTII